MEAKIFAERSYVWISNTCIFGVVAIAIAYDRISMADQLKMTLFWVAMGLGVVSFASYALRRTHLGRATRTASPSEACVPVESGQMVGDAGSDDQRTPAKYEAEATKATPILNVSSGFTTKQAHRALFFADMEVLEEVQRMYQARVTGGSYVTMRALEQNEPVKLQELLELVYQRKANLEVLAGSPVLGKVRKNPSKFVKQPVHAHRTTDIVDGLLV